MTCETQYQKMYVVDESTSYIINFDDGQMPVPAVLTDGSCGTKDIYQKHSGHRA
jgi:hypothetical protein